MTCVMSCCSFYCSSVIPVLLVLVLTMMLICLTRLVGRAKAFEWGWRWDVKLRVIVKDIVTVIKLFHDRENDNERSQTRTIFIASRQYCARVCCLVFQGHTSPKPFTQSKRQPIAALTHPHAHFDMYEHTYPRTHTIAHACTGAP